RSRSVLWCAMVTLFLLAGRARGDDAAAHPGGKNVAEMTFMTVPGLPTCAPGAVANGDPRTGPSIILGKIAAGCTIPWHWHAANEHLMLVSGTARVETKDGKPLMLRAGGFALM